MATFSILPILTTFLLSLTPFIRARNIPIQQEGFTLDLIHRDSPLSPLYNPASTRSELITNAYHRSINRAKRTLSPADITSNPTDYFMKYSIGTPPFETLGFVHTGSDLSWTQCIPCEYETDCHNITNPIFNPNKSSSYKPLSCQSDSCSALGSSVSALGSANISCNNQKECLYSMKYDDREFGHDGNLASETITFGSTSGKPLSFNNVAVGCSHPGWSDYTNNSVMGNIGLGHGPLSIVKQLNGVIQGKFSYCLAPYDGSDVMTSQISFGAHAVVEGPGVVSTPLVKNDSDTNYHLTLESLHVRNKTLLYRKNSNDNGSSDVQEGNIIIDLGSTFTVLPQDLYYDLEMELRNAIGLPTSSDPNEFFSLCYCVRNRDELNIPNITVSFTGGVDLVLPPRSTFFKNDYGNFCFAMIPIDELSSHCDDMPIFGTMSQQNFMVGYDLVNNKVSFKPSDCSSR